MSTTVRPSTRPARRHRARSRDRSWLRPAFAPSDQAPASTDVPVLDPEGRTATFADGVAVFSDVEYAVFALLSSHPHVMLTRDEIARHAWGTTSAPPDRVTSAIKRVRVRLRDAGVDPDQISTIHTLGYRWDPRDDRGAEARSA